MCTNATTDSLHALHNEGASTTLVVKFGPYKN